MSIQLHFNLFSFAALPVLFACVRLLCYFYSVDRSPYMLIHLLSLWSGGERKEIDPLAVAALVVSFLAGKKEMGGKGDSGAVPRSPIGYHQGGGMLTGCSGSLWCTTTHNEPDVRLRRHLPTKQFLPVCICDIRLISAIFWILRFSHLTCDRESSNHVFRSTLKRIKPMERKDIAVQQRHNIAERYKTAPTGANPGDRIGNGGVGRWGCN
ncbi:hypothetical protein GHT06_017851 [Daphnia sinensis]|uniref:Uncharacterized protein n=1 Tax=Daphnia sinensis TaxID=1820382 RepID=A0AAD5KLP8_9CRUS|nr:hypothetical protein GHT06_017851 [Daphnia sinensis]